MYRRSAIIWSKFHKITHFHHPTMLPVQVEFDKWLVRLAMVDLYEEHCRMMKVGYFVKFTPNNSRAAIHKLSMVL
jgi:hypothetical protein